MGADCTADPAGQVWRRQTDGDHARGGERVLCTFCRPAVSGAQSRKTCPRKARSTTISICGPMTAHCSASTTRFMTSVVNKRNGKPVRVPPSSISERRGQWHHRRSSESTERPMSQPNDLSRSLVILEQDATLIAVIEMGQSSWLVAGIVPGVERSPLKKLAVDESALLQLLKRAFLGWLRGERDHCKMVAIPTLAQEDAKRPNRERESLVGEQSRIVNRMKAALARLGIRGFNPKLKKAVERLDGLRTPEGEPIPPNTLAELKHDMERRRLVRSQIRDIEGTRLERLKQAPGDGPHVMVRLLARIIGVGVETADMLVQEVLSRSMRDRRAVARYAGLTGSPDESGRRRREKGLTRSGNARVRRGMIQLAWRFLMFQKDSTLAHWFYARTKNAPQTRKTMIVALARKLLIALWRLAREGAIPEGIVLRPAL